MYTGQLEIKYYTKLADGSFKVLEDEHGVVDNISSYISDIKQSYNTKTVLAVLQPKTMEVA